MDRISFRELFHPELRNPILIEGLPGFGNVGRIAAHLFIKFSGAKRFAELYSPYFPDYVIINPEGVCRPPRYEFYAASTEQSDFIVLTGDVQPSLEDINAHYEVCGEILDFVEKFGCRFAVTMGGVPMPNPGKEVYVAATSSRLVEGIVEKGALPYSKGKIMGATGLLLGLAKTRGWKGICLLGATTGLKADRGAALSVFKFLLRALGIEVKTGL